MIVFFHKGAMKVHSCFRHDHWQSKAHRAWFFLCAVCLAFYGAYVLYFSQSGFLTGGVQTAAAVLWFLLFSVGLFLVFLWACPRLRPAAVQQKDSFDLPVFLGSAALALLVLGFAFLGCYPGGVSYDAANQWQQAQSGQFNNWHPVFHTLLIWLVTRVYNHYSFAVLVQIVCFSLALGYAAASVRRTGAPRWLCLLCAYLTALMEPVRNTMMYVGKDNAMTIGCLLLFGQTVQLIRTRGAWLSKTCHALCFGLALAFTTLVRQNGFLLTLPLGLLDAGCYFRRQKKGVLTGALCCLGFLALIQGGLYSRLDIVYPDNTLEEAVGLPMTLLCNARQRKPELLDGETRAFLDTLADEDGWQNTYRRSDYNSIKFTFFREKIQSQTMTSLLSMAARTAAADPRLAFETFNEVTGLVWDVSGQDRSYQRVTNSGDLDVAQKAPRQFHAVGQAVTDLLSAPLEFLPLRWLSRNTGAQLLLLLLATLWALYHGGTERLLPVFPLLCYCLATMLLLCGQDARFFSFVAALTPLCLCAQRFLPFPEKTGFSAKTPEKNHEKGVTKFS